VLYTLRFAITYMANSKTVSALVYPDGSCDTQHRIGAWVAIILVDESKIVLSGVETNTTHNRMELVAVIEAINYLSMHQQPVNKINIYSDSQYVTGLSGRKQRLENANYVTKHGNTIQNDTLVKTLLGYIATQNIVFEKIRAHQKKTDIINYNIEADLLSRKLVRQQVKKEVKAI
jgi:ribonuclease HI